MSNNKDKVLKFMKDNSSNNVFSGSYVRIARAIGAKNSASASYVIKQLIKQGKIAVLTEPHRGMNVARYQILEEPTMQSEETPLGEIIVEFGGMKLKLVYTDIGYCISKRDLARVFTNDSVIGLDDYMDLIDLKVERNKEQFVPNMTVVNGEQYLNKIATMLYFNKLDLVQANDEKRTALNEFQIMLASTMCDVMLKGSVSISENDTVKLQTNLSTLCELSIEQVKDFLENIEHEFQSIVNTKSREFSAISKKLQEAEFVINQKNDIITSQKAEITQLRINH